MLMMAKNVTSQCGPLFSMQRLLQSVPPTTLAVPKVEQQIWEIRQNSADYLFVCGILRLSVKFDAAALD